MWKDALSVKASAPYLNHLLAGGGTSAVSARFCPYDDALGVGHTRGICSLLVRRRTPQLCFRQAHAPHSRLASRRHRRQARCERVTLGATANTAASDISWAASLGFSCTVLPNKLR